MKDELIPVYQFLAENVPGWAELSEKVATQHYGKIFLQVSKPFTAPKAREKLSTEQALVLCSNFVRRYSVKEPKVFTKFSEFQNFCRWMSTGMLPQGQMLVAIVADVFDETIADVVDVAGCPLLTGEASVMTGDALTCNPVKMISRRKSSIVLLRAILDRGGETTPVPEEVLRKYAAGDYEIKEELAVCHWIATSKVSQARLKTIRREMKNLAEKEEIKKLLGRSLAVQAECSDG